MIQATTKWTLSILQVLFISVFFSCSSNDNTIQSLLDVQTDDAPVIEEPVGENAIGLKAINSELKIGGTFSLRPNDQKYTAIHTKEFNANQALWYAGFGSWPAENTIDYTDFNAAINWMVDNQLSPHMHMIVGPNFYMPDWLKNATWTNDELDNHLKNLVYGIMDTNDNKNKVDAWNVMNEIFNQDGTYRNVDDMLWVQMGVEEDASELSGDDKINDQHPIFIRKAFGYARDKTDKILEYRDYLIEATNPANGWDKKHKAVYQLLKHMQNSDIPIDAVGIQGHYDIGDVDFVLEDNRLMNVVKKFKDLGLEVYVTELDIGSTDGTWSEELAQQQKKEYYDYIKQSIDGGAVRLYTWGIQDGADSTWRTNEHPLPWDENLEKKPAYFGIKEALEDTNRQ